MKSITAKLMLRFGERQERSRKQQRAYQVFQDNRKSFKMSEPDHDAGVVWHAEKLRLVHLAVPSLSVIGSRRVTVLSLPTPVRISRVASPTPFATCQATRNQNGDI